MIGDTIFAVASPPGAAERAILRISGPQARAAAGSLLGATPAGTRAAMEASVPVLGRRVPCLVLVMPGPRSYTGEDVVELHLPGSPLLVERIAAGLAPIARAALPGEFTRRAFEHGRMDLTEAEGLLALVHAATETERRQALEMLEGGLARAVDRVRGVVQDALALLESGLDFTEGETGAVETGSWARLLRAAGTRLSVLHDGLPAARSGGAVLLLGATNAGKSSLCNALAGHDAVLVTDRPGTTRDVLEVRIGPDLVLLDAPGDLTLAGDAPGEDTAAVALRDRLARGCDAALLVVDLCNPAIPRTALPVRAVALTKVDLVPSVPADVERDLSTAPRFPVSSVTGVGLAALREHLLRHAAPGPSGRGARLQDLLGRARDAVAAALRGADRNEPEEAIAVSIGEALALLDRVHGRSSPEDLLDRIFSSFCLGK